MDGTLLNEDCKISNRVMEALKLAKQKGILFFLATGREYDIVSPIIEEYNLQCGQILMNGSEIRDDKGNIVEAINLDKSVVPTILTIAESYGLYNEIFTDRGMFTTMEKEAYFEANAYRFHGFRPDLSLADCKEFVKEMNRYKEHTYISNVNEFIHSKVEIRKVSCFHFDLEKVKLAKEVIRKNINGIAVLSFFDDNIEITNIQAQKGLILKKLIRKMGIKTSEVAVMGDSFNDISLFEEFEHSFAVNNAIPEIKQIAKYFVSSNKHDGAAEAILKMLSLE